MCFEKGLPHVALPPDGPRAEALKNLVYCPVWNVPSDSSLPLWIPLAWTLLAVFRINWKCVEGSGSRY